MATFELSRAAVAHKRRWIGMAAATWFVFVAGHAWTRILYPALFEEAHHGTSMLLLNFVSLTLAVLFHRWPVTRSGKVIVDGDTLFVDDEAVTKRRDIRSALVVSQRGVPVVRLLRRLTHVDIEIATASEVEARALLSALGVGAAERASSFGVGWGRARSQLLSVGLVVAALLPGMIAGGFIAWMQHSQRLQQPRLLAMTAACVLLYLLGLVVFLARARATITVGSDGVFVRRGLARPLFLPYAQIVRAEATDTAYDSRLQIVCRDRAPVVCHLGLGVVASVTEKNGELIRAIASAIGEAKRGRTEEQAIPKTALTRSGRDAHAWVRALHDAAVEAAGYRVQAIPTEALWNIVCDSDAPATERAGAAVVLRANLDEDGRARLRVASATSAYPQLRIALAAAADEADEDALVEALAPLSDEPRSRAASSRG